ncbi:uncharacterized protein LOC132749420 [Ruditapes philippinarum]|uniref:uncharacterized protein LOC132749420 n=1 Tax=Ruditapes philippinarum TaxID=129788 RepID=UPI00295B7DB6|nr:uncharacterized protein LOC132749420 [Ruditapes philippinarum]XP_060595133.1 uncharacterized protein LOC132749420 [Ruditapes philippinarum]XP_060595134.1 uncharacterized protein LOC132749420 [Ruditapes philippinarum]
MEIESISEYDCGDGRCRDMFWEFVYIVVIPGALLFIIVFITSVLMCCSACKRKKPDSLTDETQLIGYNSIRRASLSLRQLSHNRDTPLLSSRANREARTASLNLDRDQRYRRGGRGTASAPGTLQRDRDRHQRHNRDRQSDIPPQYSTPPRFPSAGELNTGSGVEYAELNHGLTVAAEARQEKKQIL